MSYIFRAIKKAFLWSYERTTWQWDVLCVLILVFIFLTPKSWFANGERSNAQQHQDGPVSTVLVGAEVIVDEGDKGQIEQRVRALTGRPNAEVVEVRRRLDAMGKTVGYEVDIR
jgi:hypothetical protein